MQARPKIRMSLGACYVFALSKNRISKRHYALPPELDKVIAHHKNTPLRSSYLNR
jgi:hypothetical protein